VLALAAAVVYAQQPDDRTKARIEGGTKTVVVPGPTTVPAPVAPPRKYRTTMPGPGPGVTLDASKFSVEGGFKNFLTSVATDAAKAEAAKGFVNPKVQPGKVTWHKDFAAACAASAKSGKPVLLFQMMGKLDDQFC
jgi:hypothetical protein